MILIPGTTSAAVPFRVVDVRDREGAIAYVHPKFIERFARTYSLSLEEAEHRFAELKKFRFRSTRSGTISSSTPATIARYCKKYIGRFLHHHPTENPSLDSRPAMIALAEHLFREIDRSIWPSTEVVRCSSSCSGDDYCDDGGGD